MATVTEHKKFICVCFGKTNNNKVDNFKDMDKLTTVKKFKNILGKIKMETEAEKKTFKIHSYGAFPYSEIKHILKAIELLDYDIDIVDNGNISCTKKVHII